MSGNHEMENAPRRETGGAQERDSEHVPSENSPILPGIDGTGEGECLLSGGVPHSTSDAVQFLQGWCEEGPWVLTSIVPDGGGITTATFNGATIPQMHQWIEARQGRQNIYFTVNAVCGEVEAKPNKGAISGIHAVHVDVDPRPGEDVEAERERAINLLRAYNPPPTVIIDSGGGAQGFWRLGEAVPTGGSRALVRASAPRQRQKADAGGAGHG